MDSRVSNGDSEEYWTDEKHLHFLKNMEASFVRTMFEGNGLLLLPLDRYLPDSSESTNDLKTHRRKKITGGVRMGSRSEKRRKRASSKAYDSSKDQVVPHFENKSEDRVHDADHPNVSITNNS